MIIFPLEFMKNAEMYYPGTLALCKPGFSEEQRRLILNVSGVKAADHNIMMALSYWQNDKVHYCFSDEVSKEILGAATMAPEQPLPMPVLKRLPYPCFSVSFSPFEIMGQRSTSYTGCGFIFLTSGRDLAAIWQTSEGDWDWTTLDLQAQCSLRDCYDDIVERDMLSYLDTYAIRRIKRVLGIRSFLEACHGTTALVKKVREKCGKMDASVLYHSMDKATFQVALLSYVVQIILYLNCSNADIEKAEEKLKAGAWASLLDGAPTRAPIPRGAVRRALRDNENVCAFDVGYRNAGQFRRSYSSNRSTSDPSLSTVVTLGYGTRRAHHHHFWIGPRSGPLADDIMNPQVGERGLKLRWVEATEIHPELRNDLAAVIKVDRQ